MQELIDIFTLSLKEVGMRWSGREPRGQYWLGDAPSLAIRHIVRGVGSGEGFITHLSPQLFTLFTLNDNVQVYEIKLLCHC